MAEKSLVLAEREGFEPSIRTLIPKMTGGNHYSEMTGICDRLERYCASSGRLETSRFAPRVCRLSGVVAVRRTAPR
jgi:hypothetical protein